MHSKMLFKNPWSYAPWIMFLVGCWISVIRNMGPGLTYIPGNLGDNRFNIYQLEHFYRWVVGLDASYWNAAIFYPFPNTTAFGDNLLGTAPLYAFFREFGFDRETAFQIWYIFGFFFNFVSAFYVLHRIGAKPLAGGVGAFFFSFGLPLISQEGHAQLIYRCGVPFACYFLWDFSDRPKLWKLLLVGLSLVWQIYASIYAGIFLGLLLLATFILFPFFQSSTKGESVFFILPKKLESSWRETSLIWRAIFVVSNIALLACLFFLLQPYYSVTRMYGFTRTLSEVSFMLPQPESYFLADWSLIWGKLSASMQNIKYLRWEHQLFPGSAVIILILASLVWPAKSEYRKLARLYLGATLMLIIATLNLHGYSYYPLVMMIPGVDSIRAVSRIVLVLMWPIAVFITSVLDSMLETTFSAKMKAANWFAYTLIILLVVESLAFSHSHFSKTVARNRLADIKSMIPTEIPQEPILVLHINQEDWYLGILDEIDAILAAQDLGWPTLNGYSGNYSEGYRSPGTCHNVSELIQAYMRFAGIIDQQFHSRIISRTVPIGFNDCNH